MIITSPMRMLVPLVGKCTSYSDLRSGLNLLGHCINILFSFLILIGNMVHNCRLNNLAPLYLCNLFKCGCRLCLPCTD